MVDNSFRVLFWKNMKKMWKNSRFYGRLRLDWGNATRAATDGLGSIGLS